MVIELIDGPDWEVMQEIINTKCDELIIARVDMEGY